MGNIINIKNVTKKFLKNNEEVKILNEVNLDIRKGEFITIVGKSGCGKSTLLKLISGMIPLTSGEILINKKNVNGINKDCSMIFQEARLFPWLKIKDSYCALILNNEPAYNTIDGKWLTDYCNLRRRRRSTCR